MKRAIAVLLSALSLIACTSCGSKEEVPDIEPQISQMRSICELAVMECYYHNVAKFKEEDASGFWLWKKDKHFWIEYSGIVELGIEASLVEMEVSGDTVSITLPPAEVKNCKVDSASLTEDSFIVDKNSAQIDAEDETAQRQPDGGGRGHRHSPPEQRPAKGSGATGELCEKYWQHDWKGLYDPVDLCGQGWEPDRDGNVRSRPRWRKQWSSGLK